MLCVCAADIFVIKNGQLSLIALFEFLAIVRGCVRMMLLFEIPYEYGTQNSFSMLAED